MLRFSLAILLVPTLAFAADIEGQFIVNHETGLNDQVSVTEDPGGGVYSVTIETVANKSDKCTFEGKVVSQVGNVLMASQPSQVWARAEERFVPGICNVQIIYRDGNTISVQVMNSASCTALCGASARLGIERAERVN